MRQYVLDSGSINNYTIFKHVFTMTSVDELQILYKNILITLNLKSISGFDKVFLLFEILMYIITINITLGK